MIKPGDKVVCRTADRYVYEVEVVNIFNEVWLKEFPTWMRASFFKPAPDQPAEVPKGETAPENPKLNFLPGDKVVCVRPTDGLEVGRVYTVDVHITGAKWVCLREGGKPVDEQALRPAQNQAANVTVARQQTVESKSESDIYAGILTSLNPDMPPVITAAQSLIAAKLARINKTEPLSIRHWKDVERCARMVINWLKTGDED